MIRLAKPNKEVLSIQSMEAFIKAADGKATKIIIPSEIQGIAGLASSLTEIMKKDEDYESYHEEVKEEEETNKENN